MPRLAHLYGFFREQRDALWLASRVAECAARGHQDGQTIIWKDEYKVVCPNCGKDL